MRMDSCKGISLQVLFFVITGTFPVQCLVIEPNPKKDVQSSSLKEKQRCSVEITAISVIGCC